MSPRLVSRMPVMERWADSSSPQSVREVERLPQQGLCRPVLFLEVGNEPRIEQRGDELAGVAEPACQGQRLVH